MVSNKFITLFYIPCDVKSLPIYSNLKCGYPTSGF